MTTLKKLSAYTGISVTQVSRAINDHSDVSEKTKAIVRAAAKELGYRPNLSARKLVSGRSGIIGFVLPEPPAAPFDGLIIQMLGHLSTAFARSGLQFILHIAPEREEILETYEKLIAEGGLDGFFIGEPVVSDPRVSFLEEKGIPFVLHGRDYSDRQYPFLDIDNELVGYTLAEYLIAQGHRRIAFLNGRKDLTYASARERGYRRALQEAGLQFNADLVINSHMTIDFGREAARRLLVETTVRPTAIIAGNTWVAKGIYEAAAGLGLVIPDDFSVVAHDDNLRGTNVTEMQPRLTATTSPLDEHWDIVSEFLVGAILGKPHDQLQQIVPINFISRDSAKPVEGA